jgi:CRP-like cAMP-binding protein
MSLFERSMTYNTGEVIIKEGDTNRDLYILVSGTLEASVTNESNEIVVSEMNAPEILGEISFLNGSPRTATVKAKTDVEVYILSYEKVKEELSDIPTWFKMILLAFTNRVKVCGAKIKEYDHKVQELQKELEKCKKS